MIPSLSFFDNLRQFDFIRLLSDRKLKINPAPIPNAIATSVPMITGALNVKSKGTSEVNFETMSAEWVSPRCGKNVWPKKYAIVDDKQLDAVTPAKIVNSSFSVPLFVSMSARKIKPNTINGRIAIKISMRTELIE